MRTYKIYGTWSGATNNIASITIAKACRIRSIRWSVWLDAPADNSTFGGELSFMPSSQMGVNDTIGSVDEVHAYINLVTSGMYQGEIHKQSWVDIPAAAGERLYLNGTATTTSVLATVFVDVDEGRS